MNMENEKLNETFKSFYWNCVLHVILLQMKGRDEMNYIQLQFETRLYLCITKIMKKS